MTDETPEQAAVRLFARVAASVPAYRKFLGEHGIEAESVTTYADFRRLPLLDKPGYVRRYPLPELCRDGRLGEVIALSSGSTGEPTPWPRGRADEHAISARFEQIFRDGFDAGERSTLAVVCFTLGTWVGGLFTLDCVRELAARYPITAVAPGNNKDEIMRVLTRLGSLFDQVVLLGYPPFLKDVIDSGRAAGFDWDRYRIKMVTAGEVFSESWRTLVAERAGMSDPVRDIASLYGTADAGVLGNETPLSVRIRRFLADRPDAARELFGSPRLPTLVQYDPYQRFFEEVDGTLLFSGDSGVPLIRYHIADEGGLIPHDRMLEFVGRHGLHPTATTPELPFVYVFGRSRFTISFYGANIFPENISVGLEQPDVCDDVTGKFVLESMEDSDHNRLLTIDVELAPGHSGSTDLAERVAESIQRELLRLNSEFAHYVPTERQRPVIRLHPHADPEYFPAGVKHRYTRNP